MQKIIDDIKEAVKNLGDIDPQSISIDDDFESNKKSNDYFDSVSPEKIVKIIDGIEKMHKELHMWRND